MNYLKISEAIVRQISEVAGVNDPQTKIDPPGFLEMLLDNSPTIIPEYIVRNGLCREVRLQYMPRACENVRDCHECGGELPQWRESGTEPMHCKEIGIMLNDDIMCQLEEAANRPVSMGRPAVSAPSILWDLVRQNLNGLLKEIDKDLLNMQSAKWGMNVAYGDVGPANLTFGNTMSLDNGIIRLKSDARVNGFDGMFTVVGNGVIVDFAEMNRMRTGTDPYGYGRASFETGFRTYDDLYSEGQWGVNHFGVFAENTIGLLQWYHNDGYNGKLFGDTVRFVLPVPIGNGYVVNFDAYLKTAGCPNYTTTLILGKTYGLWNMPDDVYDTCDRLSGVNGSLHYVGDYKGCFDVCGIPAPVPTP